MQDDDDNKLTNTGYKVTLCEDVKYMLLYPFCLHLHTSMHFGKIIYFYHPLFRKRYLNCLNNPVRYVILIFKATWLADFNEKQTHSLLSVDVF